MLCNSMVSLHRSMCMSDGAMVLAQKLHGFRNLGHEHVLQNSQNIIDVKAAIMFCNMPIHSRQKNGMYVIFLSHTIILKAVISHTWILFFPQPSDFEILILW